MGLESVKEEIIRNAKVQEEAALAEARSKANDITKEAEKKIAEMKEKIDMDTKRMSEMIKKQELASAELENKKMLLEAKKQMIDKVFAEAKKKIEKSDSKKNETSIGKLLEKAGNDIEVANVFCNEKDVKNVKGVNAQTTDILGGLIAENKEGTIRVDYSFDTILESLKENELQNINKILFE